MLLPPTSRQEHSNQVLESKDGRKVEKAQPCVRAVMQRQSQDPRRVAVHAPASLDGGFGVGVPWEPSPIAHGRRTGAESHRNPSPVRQGGHGRVIVGREGRQAMHTILHCSPALQSENRGMANPSDCHLIAENTYGEGRGMQRKGANLSFSRERSETGSSRLNKSRP